MEDHQNLGLLGHIVIFLKGDKVHMLSLIWTIMPLDGGMEPAPLLTPNEGIAKALAILVGDDAIWMQKEEIDCDFEINYVFSHWKWSSINTTLNCN